jgi:hypothetical protein
MLDLAKIMNGAIHDEWESTTSLGTKARGLIILVRTAMMNVNSR